MDTTPKTLTPEEFKTCYAFLTGNNAGIGISLVSEFFTVTGQECDPYANTTECPENTCAQASWSSDAKNICCHTPNDYFVEFEEAEAANYSNSNDTEAWVCGDQAAGAACFNNKMCESQSCEDNVCVSSKVNVVNNTAVAEDAKNEATLELGDYCNATHGDCVSGLCLDKVCKPHPQVCPTPGVEMLGQFGGLRLDPYCRNQSDWCRVNNFDAINAGLGFVEKLFGVDMDLIENKTGVETDPCQLVLDTIVAVQELLPFNVIKILNESDPNIVQEPYYTPIYNVSLFSCCILFHLDLL